MMQGFEGTGDSLCVAAFIVTTALLACSAPQSASAQVATGGEDPAPHIVFRRFSYPIYPPLARANNIVGDVVLKVSYRPDGSIESLAVVSGDPVLTQAALDSAKQSLLQCRGCSSSDLSQSLTYSFRIFPAKADPCCCTSRPGVTATPPTTQVSQLWNHITITEPPLCMCPDKCSEAWAQAHSRHRSAKCLYLWKCGKRRILLQ
jgi:Gram-negative bacterial TonB protein C-terminal